ncbi:MAG: nicotinate-nucleotide adenylyltransferase [Bacillota bacterium]|jgi:nicotinate-nucleotide adenylyltransferase|nr:nicotinate-nucleotide adenylyltransferase [Candidatus Fermentithermobacillaceae bacterium]
MTAIGIMGGTFDPVHHGHLRAAEEVRQGFGLERVVFVPSGRPPHKVAEEVTSPEHRYLMTLLATADNPHFEVSRMEIDREGPSYTLDSLRELRRHYSPEKAFYFITGLDAVLDITSWNGYMELFDLADFIAVTRPGYSVETLNDLGVHLGEERFSKIHPFPVTLLAISSRDIRKRVKEGRSVKYLVPDPVMKYIEKERLYLTDPERRVIRAGSPNFLA